MERHGHERVVIICDSGSEETVSGFEDPRHTCCNHMTGCISGWPVAHRSNIENYNQKKVHVELRTRDGRWMP